MISGIYKILNTTNNKFYIGSAVNLKRRFNAHRTKLATAKHRNIHLQRSYDKHGLLAFEFIILEYCEVEILIEREQFYLDTLKPHYNIARVAGSSLGLTHSDEVKLKISISKTGTKQSEETKLKRAIALKGNKSRTGQTIPKEEIEKKRLAIRRFDKWPHEKGNKCSCKECNQTHMRDRKLRKEKLDLILANVTIINIGVMLND